MNPVEYVFRIDAFQPETLPMSRLAQYLAALARMLGHDDHIHFVGVEQGSAKLRAAVEPVDAPKVEARLNGVRVGDAPKEALAAKQALEDLLANDNAVGTLTEGADERVVLPFEGRNRRKLLTFAPFREETSIDGVIVSIGGRDSTAHAQLQDGDVLHVGVTMDRQLARELAKLLYGSPVRLFGNGRFERNDAGVWKMTDFRVDRHEVLNDASVREALDTVRSVAGSQLLAPNAYDQLAAQRNGEGADQQ